jgi:hypothetical protein
VTLFREIYRASRREGELNPFIKIMNGILLKTGFGLETPEEKMVHEISHIIIESCRYSRQSRRL